ncbi:MAG: SGNH/GDSL hydrolase family protein [Planctomycetota bacterium]
MTFTNGRLLLVVLATASCMITGAVVAQNSATPQPAQTEAAKKSTPAQAKGKAAAKKLAAKKNAAFEPVNDDPALPRVLLLGDSISIGYTVPVREALKGKANVHRPADNCGPTIKGLEKIDEWLGDGRWDVIHFNWGLHDLKFVDGTQQVSLADYETNLRKLVARLKQTGAKLIWCSTTPVPEGVSPPRTDADVLAYNAAAKNIADAEGIAIDDLYTFAKPRLTEIQMPANVHFTPEGSAKLAEAVAASIEKAISK